MWSEALIIRDYFSLKWLQMQVPVGCPLEFKHPLHKVDSLNGDWKQQQQQQQQALFAWL